jgi:hypothetical protein
MEPMERPLPPIPQFHAVLIEVVPDEPPLDVIAVEEEPGSSGVGVVLVVVPVFLFLVFLAIVGIRQYRVPPAPPALLRAPEQLVVQGGESAVLTVEFELPDRERGPFQVKLFDLPSPLKGRADPVEVSPTAGDARVVRYHIEAPLNAPENSVNLRVQLHRLDTVVEERMVRLIVHRADLPRLVEVVSPRRIEVGGRTRFTFDIDRRGYRQKLYLDLLNLPRSINRDPAEPGGEGGQLSLNLHVPGSLQGDTVVTYLRLMMQSEEPDQPDFEVDRARLALEFVAPRPSRPFLQADRRGVEISQGGEATLRVQVDRKLFGRPLRLSLRNLPVGITANDASVTTSSESGVFLLTATPQTALTPGPVPVDIVAYDGLDEIGKIQTTLRVTPQDSVENP